jgi:hypothetical protein
MKKKVNSRGVNFRKVKVVDLKNSMLKKNQDQVLTTYIWISKHTLLFRFRKTIQISETMWKPAYANPSSATFIREKEIREEYFNDILSGSEALMTMGLGGLTVLSIKLVDADTYEDTEIKIDGVILELETEMVFSTDTNITYSTMIDEFFKAKQGDFIESTPVGKS